MLFDCDTGDSVVMCKVAERAKCLCVFFCVCADMHNILQYFNCVVVKKLGQTTVRERDPVPGASIGNSDTSDSFFPGRTDIYEIQRTYGIRGKKHAEGHGCSCDMRSLCMG